MHKIFNIKRKILMVIHNYKSMLYEQLIHSVQTETNQHDTYGITLMMIHSFKIYV